MNEFVLESEEFRRELQNSPHEAGEVEFLRSVLRPGMHVIEAGANRGVTAVAIAREIGSVGRLYTFEPVPEFYEELKASLVRNDAQNVSAHQLALSNQPGRIELYKRGGESGITPAEDAEMLRVEATNIADFVAEHKIDRVDLLYLDCEGSELLVLRGAKRILEEQGPQIFCELHREYLKELGHSADDVTTLLTGIGYDVRPLQVENLDAETSLDDCSHIYASRPAPSQADELRRRIEDLKSRLPAHSVRASMLIELEELEEQLEWAIQESKSAESDSTEQ